MKIQNLKIEMLNDLINKCGIQVIDNFYLQLNKGIKVEKEKKSKEEEKKQKKKNGKSQFKLAIEQFNSINKYDKFISCYEFTRKQDYLIKTFDAQGYEVSKYRFIPFNKIIVGLGQESVREVSMTLHWIYGIPYIPGQAIKGVLSNWMREETNLDENFHLIFGREENKGQVIFMDAYPENWDFNISLDIMNPHYFYYYTGDMGPTDYQNPNPIFFLTLKNIKFNINLVYINKKLKDEKIAGKTLEEWLIKALEVGGIGAKTALGYGKGKLIPIKGD